MIVVGKRDDGALLVDMGDEMPLKACIVFPKKNKRSDFMSIVALIRDGDWIEIDDNLEKEKLKKKIQNLMGMDVIY